MKSLRINSDPIHEDLLIEILSRLPLESLHRFKWVSKSWFSTVTGEILPRITQSPSMGFFYSVVGYRILDVPVSNNGRATNFFRYVEPYNNSNNSKSIGIDPTFSFLPSCYHQLQIIDCCYGLVLSSFGKFEGEATKTVYLVCNPSTKSWTELPSTDHYSSGILVFDPRVSPHYKVVKRFYDYRDDHWAFNIYYSETRRSERLRIVGCGDVRLSLYCSLRNYALCQGSMYIESGDRIIRVGSFGGGDVVAEHIKLPEDASSVEMCIGTSVDKLYFACLKGVRLKVWTLRGRRKNKWAARHDCRLHGIGQYHPINPPRVVGFHPSSLDEVFILLNGLIFTCDLKNKRLNEICRIGSELQEAWLASLFFFSPCLVDLLQNRSKI